MLKRTATVLVTAVAITTSLPSAAEAQRKPNFVFILVDDLGWTDLGCFGSSFYETPNVDKLCASGMKFTNAYAACPVCSPTRASIMTGKYPTRTGITDYIGAAHSNRWRRNTILSPPAYTPQLEHKETTLAEAFKEAGYATFFAGKWHLGGEQFWPEHQGFDVNKGGHHRGGPYGGKKYFSPYGNPRLSDGPAGEHLPNRLAAETVKFIEANGTRPFLAYLSFYSVHTPLMSRPDLKQKYMRKRSKLGNAGPIWGKERSRKLRLVQEHAVYGGMVEAMDQAVGKVANALSKMRLTDNTIVIFMSDNGGLSTSEGHPTSNLPLRAGKGWMYEGGIREPMFIKWPGVTRPGSKCATPVTSTDFYPTMLEIAGLRPKPQQHVDGKSLVPLLRRKKFERGPIFWHYPHYGNQGGAPSAAVRHGDWKLIEWFEDGSLELFNLRQDIGEKSNLIGRYPQKVAELRAQLKQFLTDSGAKMPTKNPRYKKR